MMYSVAPLSVLALSDTGRTVRGYFSMELSLEVSFRFIIYVASAAGFATRPDDNPPSQPFRATLESYRFSRSILQGDIGVFTTGTGSLVISNADAHYDFLPQNYTPDARPILIRATRPGGSYAQAFVVANITATGWTVDTDNVSIDLVDYSYKLDVPMQPNLYGGTGGADGGSDLAGKRLPRCFGYVHEIPAVALDNATLTYQVNNGPVEDIVAVYDRGVALTKGADYASYAALEAASIGAGYFATCNAGGYFRLETTASGLITADVKGDNSDGYIIRTADIVRWALRNQTTLVDPDDLDVASFTALNLAQPSPIDYWIGPDEALSVAAFIANIMGGIGGWGGHKRDGLFEVRRFIAPAGSPVMAFSRADMLGSDLKREPLPSAYRPPPWRWRVPYARAWTTQKIDIDSVDATAEHISFVAEPYRLAEISNEAIKVDYPFAQDRQPIDAYFTEAQGARDEARRRINLFQNSRNIYVMRLPRRALHLNIGDVIKMAHPRFDLALGKLMTVVEIDETIEMTDGSVDSVEVKAYG